MNLPPPVSEPQLPFPVRFVFSFSLSLPKPVVIEREGSAVSVIETFPRSFQGISVERKRVVILVLNDHLDDKVPAGYRVVISHPAYPSWKVTDYHPLAIAVKVKSAKIETHKFKFPSKPTWSRHGS